MNRSRLTKEPRGRLIAGAGNEEQTFYVPVSALKQSPVIKDWMNDNESLPLAMRNGDALYFPKCDPEVVQLTINYLERKAQTKGVMGAFDVLDEHTDIVFLVKLYKFALCLGLDELCGLFFARIKAQPCSMDTFLQVSSLSADNLVEDRRFHTWMMEYVEKKAEVLKESTHLKEKVMQDSALAWGLCSTLITLLGQRYQQQSDWESSGPGTPSDRSSRTSISPLQEREKSPYSYRPLPGSPNHRESTCRVKKPQKGARRKFNPRVEEVIDREFLSPRY